MALVTETGAITEGANSYASIETCDAYHTDRQNSDWLSAQTASKTAALIKATAYLDGKYRRRWVGSRISSLQPLEWPRAVSAIRAPEYMDGYATVYETPNNTIPAEIIHAVCELALRALSGPLAVDIRPKDRVVRKKVDVLETEYKTGDFTTTYQVVDQLVSRWTRNDNEAVRG